MYLQSILYTLLQFYLKYQRFLMKIKAYAKVNIFLKIVGHDGIYHLIKSRFMKVKNIYDEIEIREADKFDIVGNLIVY